MCEPFSDRLFCFFGVVLDILIVVAVIVCALYSSVLHPRIRLARCVCFAWVAFCVPVDFVPSVCNEGHESDEGHESNEGDEEKEPVQNGNLERLLV